MLKAFKLHTRHCGLRDIDTDPRPAFSPQGLFSRRRSADFGDALAKSFGSFTQYP